MYKRSNQEWVDELRGTGGPEPQGQAFEDLRAYMYRVAYNYLLYRQGQANPRVLTSFPPRELATFAQDFVQETQVKLVDNDFALLDKFAGKGAFTSWVAKVLKNEAAKELRKSYWERWASRLEEGGEQDEEWSPTFELVIPSQDVSLEDEAILREERQALQECLERLKDDQRVALLGLVVEELSGEQLARILKRPSRNAVFLLKRRAVRNMRKCLEKKGWVRGDLDIF